MPDLFFDVFDELQFSNSLHTILKDAYVIRISMNKSHTIMRLYLKFQTLIPKNRIKKMEEEIKNQYFQDDIVSVSIIESFQLSEQFTPEKVYEQYRDSMLDELFMDHHLLYSFIKNAKISFDHQHIFVEVDDYSVVKTYEASIYQYLFKIFHDRCGLEITIDIHYKEVEKNQYRKENELIIKNKVDAIFETESNHSKTALMEEDHTSVSKNKKKDVPVKQSQAPSSYSDNKKEAGASHSAWNQNNYKPKETGRPNSIKKSDNLAVLFGRDIEGEVFPINEITEDMNEVVFRGEVISINAKELRSGKYIIIINLADENDAIYVNLFVPGNFAEGLLKELSAASFMKIKGKPQYDDFNKEIVVSRIIGIEKINDYKIKRNDNSYEKRVELHCHTKMSDSDGISNVSDIITQAKHFGHKAIAITDHGVVQAFPDAAHSVGKDEDFKVIYGVECYLVDDTKHIVSKSSDMTLDGDFVVFDLETTGLNSKKCQIIEIGAIYYQHGEIVDRFSEFVNPMQPIPYHIIELTGIRDEDVITCDGIDIILPKFKAFCKDAVLVAHNADFDTGCLAAQCEKLNIDWEYTYMDTIPMARFLIPNLTKFKLDTVAKALKISLENHHRAIDDATCTGLIFERFVMMLKEMNISSLNELNEAATMTLEQIKRDHPYHCILLAKNDIGRINLYRLISESHLKYFHRQPKMPRSLINKYREGLIIGSACEAGELFQALLKGKPKEEIARIVSFYDYLEIQPIGNNEFLIRDKKTGVEIKEDLQDFNKQIVMLGTEFNKPVVATCDVHFLNPEDEIYRRIIMYQKGFSDADLQGPLYLHTTEEMLDEFSYLGVDKAREVVIDATNQIADMCEKIQPTRPDKCPPVIDNSDGLLRKICYNKAHEVYGEDLPKIVVDRLERELNSIISNGYAVMYIIAQKLVWKSNEDGYLVGSRGSVGSSFVATMAGITEVNPLQPHYICPTCHYADFNSPEVLTFSGRAGCDMPDKECPSCKTLMKKDGFDIPFETFLGFKGNKEPDIDLNFSGDYQNKAHRYTEVIFGEGQTFRAGTIGTLADNTAMSYVRYYYKEKEKLIRNAQVEHIAKGCVGVRRTTGQHPGGIIVLPMGEEINTFTPVQHPANKMDTDIITTHFDYHSIDSNLLKLDILGHDDPTMIRMLEDLIGFHAQDIPLDDEDVMSLFLNTTALKVEPEDLWNCDRGTLGIPEFGTDFAMGMLREANPTEFSDLIRISGLSHGTDVWVGNARDLILSGTATISTAICTRDDIMIYLIHMNMDSELSFTIMESVRKGKGLKPEWITDMKEHDVPDWYIESCKKIKYMFPKAHAAAYVMMAWRIAYCKIHYPLEYYAAFFSIRATAFNYEMMCMGQNTVEFHLNALDDMSKTRKLTAKENDTYRDLRIVQEMYARGFDFMPMDLYQSDARYFKIVEGKLLPPFKVLDGMGDNASEMLTIAASQSEFLSKDDLSSRGKVSRTTIEIMERLHIIQDLPESNQLSLFDF